MIEHTHYDKNGKIKILTEKELHESGSKNFAKMLEPRPVIENETFNHFRENERKVEEAKELLKKNNYVVYKKKSK
tara:strand:+ start:6094 stop:6318 length:225 start_codon:yes stop_codon:yes gene_type:complete